MINLKWIGSPREISFDIQGMSDKLKNTAIPCYYNFWLNFITSYFSIECFDFSNCFGFYFNCSILPNLGKEKNMELIKHIFWYNFGFFPDEIFQRCHQKH